MGSIAGYLAWVPSVRRKLASNAGLDCIEATIVRIPNKAAIGENLLFGPA
jgi:hypothetical protein